MTKFDTNPILPGELHDREADERALREDLDQFAQAEFDAWVDAHEQGALAEDFGDDDVPF